MNEDSAEYALELASTLGAVYADVRLEHQKKSEITLKNGVLDEVSSIVSEGIGIRIMTEEGIGFSSSNGLLSQPPKWFEENKPRPQQGRKTFTTCRYYDKDDPLRPSGLLGPVSLITRSKMADPRVEQAPVRQQCDPDQAEDARDAADPDRHQLLEAVADAYHVEQPDRGEQSD